MSLLIVRTDVCVHPCTLSRGQLLRCAVSTHSTLGVLSIVISLPGLLLPLQVSLGLWHAGWQCSGRTLPVGVSLSHWKLTCPLKVCVLISWAQCCLLVAILLLMSLMRTTWMAGCWPGWLGSKLCQVWALASTPCQLAVLLPLCGLHLPIPSPRYTPLAGANAASPGECS